MRNNAAIVEKAEVQATQEMSAAWNAYKLIGLEFGKTCYNWQQEFGGVKTQGQKGKGLRSKLIDLSIPYSTALNRMNEYKEAAGIVDVDVPEEAEELLTWLAGGRMWSD